MIAAILASCRSSSAAFIRTGSLLSSSIVLTTLVETPARSDEPVHGERRAGGHAKGREDLWMLAHECRLNIRDVVGRIKRRFNVFGGLHAGRTKCLRRELHEPVIVHIDRLDDVSFPLLRLIEVDGHSRFRLHAAFFILYRLHISPKSLRSDKFLFAASTFTSEARAGGRLNPTIWRVLGSWRGRSLFLLMRALCGLVEPRVNGLKLRRPEGQRPFTCSRHSVGTGSCDWGCFYLAGQRADA